jgi:hypothetical protein
VAPNFDIVDCETGEIYSSFTSLGRAVEEISSCGLKVTGIDYHPDGAFIYVIGRN